jgi:hypothetical protein
LGRDNSHLKNLSTGKSSTHHVLSQTPHKALSQALDEIIIEKLLVWNDEIVGDILGDNII